MILENRILSQQLDALVVDLQKLLDFGVVIEKAFFRNQRQVNHELSVIVEGVLEILVVHVADFSHPLLDGVHELDV